MDLIDRFCASYFTLNSISARRQVHARRALRGYEEALSKPVEEADDADLRGYLVVLLDRGLAASTVNLYLTTIRPFFRWCWQERVIDADQLMRIQGVSPPRGYNNHVPRPYSRKELTGMWLALDARWPRLPPVPRYGGGRHPVSRWRNGTSSFPRVKKHVMRLQLEAIIELALVAGLRRCEIYRLSIDDCHWDNKYIVVHGKRVDQNEKVREVPYADSTRQAIRDWFRMRGYMGPEHESLWLSVTGPDPMAPLSNERMAMILHSFGDYQLHRLRHTCATERLRTGLMTLEELRDFLGHATIHQTLAYAKLVREDVHKAAERSDAEFQRAIGRAA